jgi:hypothetical protein
LNNIFQNKILGNLISFQCFMKKSALNETTFDILVLTSRVVFPPMISIQNALRPALQRRAPFLQLCVSLSVRALFHIQEVY